jgi:hypothetical protein
VFLTGSASELTTVASCENSSAERLWIEFEMLLDGIRDFSEFCADVQLCSC